MSKVVETAHEQLKTDKRIFQVLNTVAVAAVSLTGADLSVEDTLALLKVLDEAKQRIHEITNCWL